MYLDRDVTVRVMGVVYHYVVICQRAVEVRGRRDHHLVTIETDVAVTAGDAGGEDPPVTSGEGIRVVVENRDAARSEEHTSELQSRGHLVCRLLLEKKQENVSIV